MFGGLFDFNHDGETDAFEHALGVSSVLSIGEEAQTDSNDEAACDETDPDDPEAELSDLEDKLLNLGYKEPDDCTSAADLNWRKLK